MSLFSKSAELPDVDPEISQDPISLLHFWLNIPSEPQVALLPELDLRLAALDVQAKQLIAARLDQLAMSTRDLVEIFKATSQPGPGS